MSTQDDVRRGEEAFFSFRSELTGCELVFEDDGESGYIYALDDMQEIEEAVLLYRVEHRSAVRTGALEVAWSNDGWKARVRLSGELVAILNYRSRLLFSTSNFPVPGKWSSIGQAEAVASFAVHQ